MHPGFNLVSSGHYHQSQQISKVVQENADLARLTQLRNMRQQHDIVYHPGERLRTLQQKCICASQSVVSLPRKQGPIIAHCIAGSEALCSDDA